MIKWISIIVLILVAIIVLYGACFVARGYLTAKKVMKDKPVEEYYEKRKKWYSYCPLEYISPNLKLVFVCLEDKNFFRHHGYDICKILQAVYVNLKYRKKKMGGSTITQQLAKNIYFPIHKKFSRKMAEFFVALKIEKILTKEEILDLYFNVIYYGKDQYSVRNACRFYFSLKPDEMSLNQAISLGCILPAPGTYNPLNPHGYFSKAKAVAVKRILERELISEEDAPLFLSCAFNDKLDCCKAKEYEAFFLEVYELCAAKGWPVKKACLHLKKIKKNEA